MNKSVPNFIGVFEARLDHLKRALVRHLEKPKRDRDKASIRKLIKDAKTLKKTIKQVKKEHAVVCPHCGGEL